MENEGFFKKYLDNNGNIKDFDKQLLEFEYGIKNYYFPFLVSDNSKKLEYANINSQPLTIDVSTIQKIKKKHSMDLEFLLNLKNITENSIFAFDSIRREDSKIFVPNIKNELGYPVIFVVSKDKIQDHIIVNEITSVYDKKNLVNLINNSLEQGKNIYVNPEKVKEFIYDIDLDIDELKLKQWFISNYKEKGFLNSEYYEENNLNLNNWDEVIKEDDITIFEQSDNHIRNTPEEYDPGFRYKINIKNKSIVATDLNDNYRKEIHKDTNLGEVLDYLKFIDKNTTYNFAAYEIREKMYGDKGHWIIQNKKYKEFDNVRLDNNKSEEMTDSWGEWRNRRKSNEMER